MGGDPTRTRISQSGRRISAGSTRNFAEIRRSEDSHVSLDRRLVGERSMLFLVTEQVGAQEPTPQQEFSVDRIGDLRFFGSPDEIEITNVGDVVAEGSVRSRRRSRHDRSDHPFHAGLVQPRHERVQLDGALQDQPLLGLVDLCGGDGARPHPGRDLVGEGGDT